MNANANSRSSTTSSSNSVDVQLLDNVLHRIGNPQQWDLLIVGDGSGSGWDAGCGWASCMVDRSTRGRRFFYGGTNSGSVNFAESMPYLQAINWFDAHHGKARLKQLATLSIHVLTDSQTIAHWGNRAANPSLELPRKHLAFWAGLRELGRLGYHCQFHWAPRMTTEMNWAADLIAGLCRREINLALDPGRIAGDLATRAATAIDNLVFHDPDTGQPINAHSLNRDAPSSP